MMLATKTVETVKKDRTQEIEKRRMIYRQCLCIAVDTKSKYAKSNKTLKL